MGQGPNAIPKVDTIPNFDALMHAEVMLPNSKGVKQAATDFDQSLILMAIALGIMMRIQWKAID